MRTAAVFLSMMCMYTEMFLVLAIAPNATMVVHGILFDGMHPINVVLLSCLSPAAN